MESTDVNQWRKASYSSQGGGNCVEVGQSPGTILVRDTTDREGPRLELTPAAFRQLVGKVMMGL